MPAKHPNTLRHGGPGASGENAKRAPSDQRPAAAERRGPEPGAPTSGRKSQVAGGGGERDSHHTHNPRDKGKRRGRTG
jgi:hypothetical protein